MFNSREYVEEFGLLSILDLGSKDLEEKEGVTRMKSLSLSLGVILVAIGFTLFYQTKKGTLLKTFT